MPGKLSERDICSKFITPAMTAAGWDLHSQIRKEVTFTKGRIIVRSIRKVTFRFTCTEALSEAA